MFMIGARLLAFDVAPVRRQTTDMENQKLLRLVLGKAPLPSDDVCANITPTSLFFALTLV